MRRRKLTLCTAAITSVVAASTAREGGIVDYYQDTLTPEAFAIWLIGLLLATLSPPAVALAFWLSAKRFRHAWLLHVLLVPTTFAVVQGSITLMLFAAGEPDIDGLTGWATDLAILLMLACPAASFVALGVRRAGRRHSPKPGG